jgi:hypothetical protein
LVDEGDDDGSEGGSFGDGGISSSPHRTSAASSIGSPCGKSVSGPAAAMSSSRAASAPESPVGGGRRIERRAGTGKQPAPVNKNVSASAQCVSSAHYKERKAREPCMLRLRVPVPTLIN